jgi:hypothetical protein
VGSRSYDDVDWEHTANTSREQEILREVEADIQQRIDAGEDVDKDLVNSLPVESTTDFNEPGKVRYYTPTGKKGTIIGDRDSGTFEYVPDDPEVQKIMSDYGQTTIKINNKESDFTPYSKHETEQWGTVDGQVQIENMNGGRLGQEGNYAQADQKLAEALTKQTGKTVTADEVKAYREDNDLTWHETQDGYTMQLIPTAINASTSHTGGVAIKKNQSQWGDVSHDYGD